MENQREQLLTKYTRMFTAVDNYLNTANEVQKLNNQLELLKMEQNEILAGDYVFACIGAVIGAILVSFIFGSIIPIGFFAGAILCLISLIGFFFLFNKIGNILFREKREAEAKDYHKFEKKEKQKQRIITKILLSQKTLNFSKQSKRWISSEMIPDLLMLKTPTCCRKITNL